MCFLSIFGRILAPFWLPFGSQNRPWGPPGTKRQIFKNLCFTNVKDRFFTSEGARGLPKSLPEPPLKINTFFTYLYFQNVPKMIPKGRFAGVPPFSAWGAQVEPEAARVSPGAPGGTFGLILDVPGGPPGLILGAPGTRGDPKMTHFGCPWNPGRPKN